MDREPIVLEIKRLRDRRDELAGRLARVRKSGEGASGARQEETRIEGELHRTAARIAALSNTLATLQKIGEQTTRHYQSKRQSVKF